MTDIKQLADRLLARNEDGSLCEITEEDQKAAADALERLTQPVGVEPVARVISTNSDKRKTISLVQGVHEYNTNFYSAETVARLQASNEEKDRRIEQLTEGGLVCGDCDGSGWLENREEGRHACTCMTEAEPYQLLEASNAQLQAELVSANVSALYHENELAQLQAKLDELSRLLRLVLPLAKGYAYTHPVGQNAAYCTEAEAALAKIEGSKS